MSLTKSIKEIGKDMSIYGLSKVIGQVISFFLLPLYTSYLSPEDYGVLALAGIFVGGYSIISNFGLSSAIFRFTGMAKSEEDKTAYLDTAQFLNIAFNVIFAILGLGLSSQISFLLFNAVGFEDYVKMAVLIGLVSSLSSIPLSYLRVRRKTIFVAYASLINLGVTILSTIMGLVVLQWGIWAALGGNLLGSFAGLVFLGMKVNFPQWRRYANVKVKELLNYALPMLPHKTFGFLLPIISQILIVRFLTLEYLGLYNIGYKFCLPMLLFIQLFQKAYTPFRYDILMNEKFSKNKFNQINVFYLSIISIGYTLVVLLGDDLIYWLTNSQYHLAAEYLWALALIPVAQGIYFMFGTGVEFRKRPRMMPLISGLGFVVALISANAWITPYGIVGASFSSIVGWGCMAILVYFYAQRKFAIKYSWGKMSIIVIIALFTQVLNSMIVENNIWFDFLFIGFAVALIIVVLGKNPISLLKKIKTPA